MTDRAGAVGKAAETFMDVLRGQPLALALVVMNFALLGILLYVIMSANNNRHEDRELQGELNKLLVQCIVPKA